MNNTFIFNKPAPIHNRRYNYQNLIVWKLAYNLVLDFYEIINALPDYESKNIADQMRRALTSMPLNIAEGGSSRYKRVFYNHLNYAYSSAKELEVLLMLCHDLKYIDGEHFNKLFDKLEKFKCCTYNLMAKIEQEI